MLGQFLSGIVGFERERHLIFALNTERGKLAPNSHRTSCVCISISLEMDSDLVSGPNGKQREVMLFFTPEGYTLGQPYWNRAKMYISPPPPPPNFRTYAFYFWGWYNRVVIFIKVAWCFNLILNPHVHVLLLRTWSSFNCMPRACGCVRALIHGRKSELLHVACFTKTPHVCVTDSGRMNSLVIVNRS